MGDIVRGEEASASSHGYAYHVFLSFRGTDTRKSFTDHLYHALKNAGFRTFRDNDEIPRGEELKSELHQAIKQSRVSIVVFSRDYASSTWCLDELVTILDHRATSNHVVLPVFYDVEPSEVRKQKGRVADAFASLQAHPRSHQWSTALAEAADLAGFTNDGPELKLIQKIVGVIEDKLRRTPLNIEPHLVGIHLQAKEVDMWLKDGSTDVGISLICGIGGIGKTTLAKYLYNLNFHNFEDVAFLSNIREISKQPHGLLRLQRQLISSFLRGKHEKIRNVDEGIMKIKDVISCRRILLVLDDVDPKDQLLEAVIGMRKWFYPGSKIIITSRHERLKKFSEICKVYKVKELNYMDSLCLFSRHTFGQDHPLEGYISHSKEVVHYCGGLPLALKVLGCSLFGRSVDVWKSALTKLQVILDKDILEILKISYDTLQDDHDRSIFLHIACFFAGKDKDWIVGILDTCHLFTTIGIQNLIDRCLLTIDQYNKVVMHQLIRDMGREIVRQESPDECGKRSRIWHHMDSFNVLKEKKGMEKIQGLVLNINMLNSEVRCSQINFNSNNAKKRHYKELLNESNEGISRKRHRFAFFSWSPINSISRDSNEEIEIDAFSMMHELKLLALNSVQLIGSYKEFPKRLRCLWWQGFPLSSIPTDFPMEFLVVLEMPYSNLKQIWRGTKYAMMLKCLNLSYSRNLVKTPNFSEILNLERLNLEGCTSLVEVDESIGKLDRLVFLNLKDCKNLKRLPRNIGMLEDLETMIISGYSNLNGLPMELRHLKSLRVFEADGINASRLLSAIEEVRERPWYALMRSNYVSKPRSLEISLNCLPKCLVCLSLAGCNLSNEYFPREFSNLCMLRELNLSRNPIVSLPHCFRGLSSLQKLKVKSCTKLRSLVAPLQLSFLNMGNCSSLERVVLISIKDGIKICPNDNWDKMVEFHGRFRLQSISQIDIGMLKYLGLPCLKSLQNVKVETKTCLNYKQGKCLIQGIYEFGIFSICLPGNEIPVYLSRKVKGSSISFTAPSNIANSKIVGLNVCSVFTLSGMQETYYPPPLFTKITNKSKGGKTWIYGPSYYGVPEENGKHMIWLSHWKFGDELEAGDKVNVSVIVGAGFRVVECGIKIVYQQGDDDDEAAKGYNPFAGWTHVIGGDLPRFKKTGPYSLCNHCFRIPSRPDRFFCLEDIEDGWCKQLFEPSAETTEEALAGTS